MVKSMALDILEQQAKEARHSSDQANERLSSMKTALEALEQEGRRHGYSEALTNSINHMRAYCESRRADADFRLGYADAMERAVRIVVANG